jgi:hypothetical protein
MGTCLCTDLTIASEINLIRMERRGYCAYGVTYLHTYYVHTYLITYLLTYLSCDIPVVNKNENNKRIAKSKHNCDAVVSFIKRTPCFGPCIRSSSGLNLRVGGDYTVLSHSPITADTVYHSIPTSYRRIPTPTWQTSSSATDRTLLSTRQFCTFSAPCAQSKPGP